MKQHFADEKTGISYTLQGDYYLPDLALPAEEQQPIGVWGQRHLRHIKQNRRVLYIYLLISDKLNSYLKYCFFINIQFCFNKQSVIVCFNF